MRLSKALLLGIGGCLTVALFATSCSKSDDQEKTSSETLADIAKRAVSGVTVDEVAQEVREMIENAGYVTRAYIDFPAQEMGKKGRVLIYTDKRGKSSGGVIYMRKTGYNVAPAWHWYFEDMVPKSVDKIELNDDGLWDVRFSSKDGTMIEYLQDESFVFTGADRPDWIALNGTCSTPLTDDNAMWRCFDSDSSTAWRSSLSANGEVFLELTAPFGIIDGILVVQTMDSDQPRRCTLFADGKKLQEFELEQKRASQMIRLDDGARDAKKFRLVFESIYGDGDVVAVAELALK